MKSNDFITEGILNLEKWHAEKSSQWSMTYWYFIDIQDSVDTMGVYTHDGWLYVGLLSDLHLRRIAGRSKTINKPPLLKLKSSAEKRAIVRKIFTIPYDLRRS